MACAAAVGGNYHFATQPLLLRVVATLVLIALAVFFAVKTSLGKKGWLLWQESLIEVRKIVWPTKKETLQATLGVFVMVLVMGLVLWTVDSILIRAVAWVLGH